jgi:hypothetical protein
MWSIMGWTCSLVSFFKEGQNRKHLHGKSVSTQGSRFCTAAVGVIVEYLNLWDFLSDFYLQPDVEDRHIWWLSPNGQYSAKTAYDGLFRGSTLFGLWERVWKTWARPKCRFFVWLWLLTTDVGQRIDLHAVGSLIVSVALCATRLWRPLITS